MNSTTKPVIIYDGTCGLCQASVRFISNRRRAGQFRLIALQSDEGNQRAREAGVSELEPDSVIYFDGQRYFLRSDAALEVIKHLGGLWPLFYIFRFIPRSLRDGLYRFVARHRHKIMKPESCTIEPI